MLRRHARHALATLLALAALGLGVGLAAAPRVRTPLPRLPVEGSLAYEVRDAESGELIPAKLTLVGAAGSHDPEFTRGDIGRQEDGAVLAYNRVFSLTGVGVHRVPFGTYDVHVSRGPEWTKVVVPKLKIDRKPAEIRIELKHVVDTTGWISADFHVHAAGSADSRVPMRERVFEFVSDGVEIITSTDHNVVSDYGPAIQEAGAGKYLASLIGDEVTTAGWGHFGAFPLPQQLTSAGHGAVQVRGRTAAAILRGLREQVPGALINVHHPRLDPGVGYFLIGRFDDATDTARTPGFSFDFDALEVMNGYQDPDRRSVDRTVADWFALLNHGHLVTATGNSDTHHLTYNLGGYPRNYVYLDEDRPELVTPAAIARSVRERHVLITTGPFVRLRVGGGRIGDIVPAKGGRAKVEIEVQAAPWVAVSRVTLYVNGREAKRYAVPPMPDAVRLRTTYDLSVSRDSWVAVRVDGDGFLTPVVGDGRRFAVRPFALTNPVFLDVDGNGAFDPPARHGAHAPPDRTPPAGIGTHATPPAAVPAGGHRP
jgi:hypothetical protein